MCMYMLDYKNTTRQKKRGLGQLIKRLLNL